MTTGPRVVRLVQNMPAFGFLMNPFEKRFFKILLQHFEATRDPEDTMILLGDNLANHFSIKVV